MSKISGIYVKVIAEYTSEDKVTHLAGEELFITGDQQMIYYPRPEHAIISYDGSVLNRRFESEKFAIKQAEAELQPLIQAVEVSKNQIAEEKNILELKHAQEMFNIEKAKQEAYADTVSKIMASVGPDLVAALNSSANSAMLETVTKSISPYAMAKDESVSDFVNTILRGTSLEGVVNGMNINV